VASWIAERARHAARGSGERVRVPLVFASDGWGCRCPPNFIGTDSVSHNDGETWVTVAYEPGVTPPEPPRTPVGDGETMSAGMVLLVEGYFTGERVELDLRDGGEPPEWLYHPWMLHVLRIVEVLEGDRALDARVESLGALAGAQACRLVVRDDRPPLNVRARPSPRARVVTGLDDGTPVAPVAWRGSWVQIDAPARGWIWAENARRACGP
jgi:hypothetical protein